MIDLNRTGTALVEIISEPDLTSSVQAAAYVRKVQSLLKAVGASDADMEKGSMRIDVNVSVAKEHASELGKRCEIKNLNSVRSMVDAIGASLIPRAAPAPLAKKVCLPSQNTRPTGTSSYCRQEGQ